MKHAKCIDATEDSLHHQTDGRISASPEMNEAPPACSQGMKKISGLRFNRRSIDCLPLVETIVATRRAGLGRHDKHANQATHAAVRLRWLQRRLRAKWRRQKQHRPRVAADAVCKERVWRQ
jgi:hypothetical protein